MLSKDSVMALETLDMDMSRKRLIQRRQFSRTEGCMGTPSFMDMERGRLVDIVMDMARGKLKIQ